MGSRVMGRAGLDHRKSQPSHELRQKQMGQGRTRAVCEHLILGVVCVCGGGGGVLTL